MRRVFLAGAAAVLALGGSAAMHDAVPAERVSAAAAPKNPVDVAVAEHLHSLGLALPPPAGDAVFLRRVYVDAIGTLPTSSEVTAFLDDRSADKRERLIDRLFEREEFADYWAMKWGDVLRVKSEFPINLWPNAVQAYDAWIRASLRENRRYDAMARALLTESGSNFRVPPVNFYRAVQNRDPRTLARAAALTFLGARAERWPAATLDGLASFFSRVGYKTTMEWKEEIVFFDRTLAPPAGSDRAMLPDGTIVRLPDDRDPRGIFADWLLARGNRWFARAMANRAWFWIMGRGVVHEPDDLRPDNPPANAALLDALERELVDSGFDLRQLFRLILTSATYQQSSSGDEGVDPRARYAFYEVRPLDAEVLVDALCQITGVPEAYSSAIPEPFTEMPRGTRAIALADGSISSVLLETLGRSPRDTGLLLERARQPSASERLTLLNSSHIQNKLAQGPALQSLFGQARDGRRLITDLYLTILSRPPAEPEMRTALAYVQKAPNRRAAGLDLAWALVNTVEFLHRH